MNEIKYTTDGKKVVIIGNLNAQEKIVQEIFIVNNQEVPSGENFVVKSLRNAPAISWKEKQILEIDSRYEKEYIQRQREISDINIRHSKIIQEFRNKIEYIKTATKKITPETFDLLADYITGEIKYVLVTGDNMEIMDMSSFNESYDYSLRLISFFGRDDGSFTYSINGYSDSSGGNKNFIPFRTKEDAINGLASILHGIDKISSNHKELAEKHGIQLDKNKLELLKQRSVEGFQKHINKLEKELSQLKRGMKETIESR